MNRYSRSWHEPKRLTPETSLKKRVKYYLTLKGWYVFPVLQSLGAMKGISDLIALKQGQCLFIECKSVRGRQSIHQEQFQFNIEQAGGRYIVVRSEEDLIKAGI